MGDTKGGAFDISGTLAREWLRLPTNPNGRPNADVLRPWVNGMDVKRRPSDKWIIDFGWKMDESEAALFEAPYAYGWGDDWGGNLLTDDEILGRLFQLNQVRTFKSIR